MGPSRVDGTACFAKDAGIAVFAGTTLLFFRHRGRGDLMTRNGHVPPPPRMYERSISTAANKGTACMPHTSNKREENAQRTATPCGCRISP